MSDEPEFQQMLPYEIEYTQTHVMPDGTAIKEYSVRCSSPTLKETKELWKLTFK